MFDFQFVKNICARIDFRRQVYNIRLGGEGADSGGLWSYITQGLSIDTGLKRRYASGMFDLGYFQLTASCNNLRGEMESAHDSYLECVDGLSTAEILGIDEIATRAIVVEGDQAKINHVMLARAGEDVSPQVHRAMSYRARGLRAERQMALSVPHDYYTDYTKLRRQLKTRPPIDEIEQDLPFFWRQLRTDLAPQ